MIYIFRHIKVTTIKHHHDNKCLWLDTCSFILAPNTWANMFGSGLSSWVNASPVAEMVALQWFLPFNHGRDDIAIAGPRKFRTIMFDRQDSSGSLNPCTIRVHNITGAAVLETLYEELAHFKPGFIAPISCFVCVSLDWLYAGWHARNEK